MLYLISAVILFILSIVTAIRGKNTKDSIKAIIGVLIAIVITYLGYSSLNNPVPNIDMLPYTTDSEKTSAEQNTTINVESPANRGNYVD